MADHDTLMVEHTQGPWHVGDGNGEGSIFAAEGRMEMTERGTTLTPIAKVFDWKGDQEANARHIVKCVNHHDELVAALRAIVYPNNGRTIDFDSKREYYRAFIEGGELDNARAILDKVKGDGK